MINTDMFGCFFFPSPTYSKETSQSMTNLDAGGRKNMKKGEGKTTIISIINIMVKFNFHSTDTCQANTHKQRRHTHIMFCVNKRSRLGDRHNNVGRDDDTESDEATSADAYEFVAFLLIARPRGK
jgi:hypothetical protein